MRRHTLMLLLVLFGASAASAQYVMSGKIEFERRVNMHARMKDYGDDNNSWYERMKKEVPRYNITYFDMAFDRNRTLYKPGREPETPTKSGWGNDPANENIVFTDLHTKRVSAMKQVFEQKYLVQDTMRTMDWKLKDEIRTIAGYKCRKAVGVICDSVYVVAFYCEDILAQGGPEMFGNLPGMVMEIAVPRLHATWTALRVDLVAVKDEDFEMKPKGKKATNKEVYEAVVAGMKDWGKWGTKYIWLCAL